MVLVYLDIQSHILKSKDNIINWNHRKFFSFFFKIYLLRISISSPPSFSLPLPTFPFLSCSNGFVWMLIFIDLDRVGRTLDFQGAGNPGRNSLCLDDLHPDNSACSQKLLQVSFYKDFREWDTSNWDYRTKFWMMESYYVHTKIFIL